VVLPVAAVVVDKRSVVTPSTGLGAARWRAMRPVLVEMTVVWAAVL